MNRVSAFLFLLVSLWFLSGASGEIIGPVSGHCAAGDFCDCEDEFCLQCVSSFGGCCYRFQHEEKFTKGAWKCSSQHPTDATVVQKQCAQTCIEGIDHPCAECGHVGHVQDCLSCNDGYTMVFSGNVHACCPNTDESSMEEKIVTGASLFVVGVGSLGTTAVLMWFLFVKRKRGGGDDSDSDGFPDLPSRL
eukprot:TRINITY_DN13097_c0_g1_i1.p1 TRINITY_DN13097_c0_g1~~TRINITY_DN13097_c0_g1_i1.p1  ORF type:complete len:191 (+),score=23.51 TRINITY_DN13097_c0_g1_i1:77-649(+)